MSSPIIPSRRGLRLGIKLLFVYLKTNFKLFFLAFIVSLSVVGIAPEIFPKLFVNQTHRIGLEGNVTISTLPEIVQNELSIGLTMLAPDKEATPGAALNWSATDSGKTYTFSLDPTLVWHDGTPFDASSVNYNLKGVTVTRPDSHTIVFKLNDPFAPLPTLLSQPLFKNGLIGLGHSELAGIKLSRGFVESIELVDNTTGSKKAYKFYPNEQSLITALKLGTIDEAVGLHQAYGLESDPHYQINVSTDSGTVAAIIFNLNQKLLEEKSIRQALSYALPDEYPAGLKANSPISVDNWAFNPNIKLYPQNTALASKTLSSASPSAKTKLTLTTSALLESTANIVAEAWNKAGVETKVVVSDIVSPGFEAYLTYLPLPKDPDQYILWHSTQMGNLGRYNSPRVDRLLEEGRQTTNQTERKAIYLNFQRAIAEDVPAIFLFYPSLYSITRK